MIQIKSEKRKNPQDKDADPKIYLTTESRGRIELNELMDEVCDDSTIDNGEVLLALRRTFKKIIGYLLLGFTVNLEELGYFNIHISSEGVDNEKDATADKIRRTRVVFYPGTGLRKAIKNAKFEKVQSRIKK